MGRDAPAANDARTVSPGWVAAPLLCLVALAGAHAYALWPAPLFPMDDAYIVQHNASVLWHGPDRSFGGAPALSGTTSLLHLALLSLLAAAMPMAWAAWLAAWLGIGALGLGVVKLARQQAMPPHLTAALVVIALCAADSAYQLLNGIETGMAMAAIVWAFALHGEPAPRRAWLAPLVLGLLPLVRPELILLAALLLVDRARVAPKGQRGSALLQGGLVASLPLLAGALAYWSNTGLPFATTAGAKRDFFAKGCLPLGQRLTLFNSGTLIFLGRLNLTALGLPLLLWTRVRWVPLLFTVGFVAAYVGALPDASHHNDHRYLYPFAALGLVGLALAWSRSQGTRRRAMAGLILLASLGAVGGLPRSYPLYLRDLALTAKGLGGVAHFIRERLPRDAPLLVHDVGFLSDRVDNPLVDVVGLKNPRAAELHREITWASCGRQRARVFARLALERDARHFVVFAGWDRGLGITRGLTELGWTLVPLRPPRALYQVYRMVPARRSP